MNTQIQVQSMSMLNQAIGRRYNNRLPHTEPGFHRLARSWYQVKILKETARSRACRGCPRSALWASRMGRPLRHLFPELARKPSRMFDHRSNYPHASEAKSSRSRNFRSLEPRISTTIKRCIGKIPKTHLVSRCATNTRNSQQVEAEKQAWTTWCPKASSRLTCRD